MPWPKKEPMDVRIEFAIKALRTDNFRALCAEYGISAKTGYKWSRRFLEQGTAGMAEQSRRPHGHADQLSEAMVCEIIRLKNAHRHWGPKRFGSYICVGMGASPAKAVSSGFWNVL